MPSASGNYGFQKATKQNITNTNGVWGYGNISVDQYRKGTWSRTWTRTPGFGKINKDLPMNDFLFVNERENFEQGQQMYEDINLITNSIYQSIDVGTFNLGYIYPSRSNNDLDILTARSIAKLLSGLKDQDVNVGVAVAEGRQTINLIAENAKKLAKSAFSLRKGDFAGAARELGLFPKGKKRKPSSATNSLAQNWLELQYGWKPLLSDIYGAAQFLAKQGNLSNRNRIQSQSTKTENFSSQSETALEVVSDRWSMVHTVKYVVYFSEPLGGNPPVALGLTNPLAIAWELVPFSFVVDWFLPVGTYLGNLDATSGLVFVRGCKTEFWKGISQRMEVGKSYVSGSHRISLIKRFKKNWESVYCKRTKLNGFPSNKLPSFKNPFSGFHVANATALLAQAFKK